MIDINDFPNELKMFDDLSYEDKEAVPVPDGSYNAVIISHNIKTSNNGNLMLVWKLYIVSPKEHEGKNIYKTNMLITEINMSWLKKDLSLLGKPDIKLDDLNRNWNTFSDILISVTKKTVNDFENIYFNEMLDPSYSGNNNDADIPF